MNVEPDPLAAQGVAVDTDALLRLRVLVNHIPERKLAPAGMPGGMVTKRRGRGLETNDIRVFSFGDDIRHIDHNTTARSGVTHVRTFHDERERTAILIADFRPCMLWGTRRALRSVAAAEALALIGWRIIESGGRVGLIAFGAGAPVHVAARGRQRGMASVIGGMAAAHRAALLALANAESTEDPPLDGALEIAAGLAPTGSAVFLASGMDRPGDGFDSLARALCRRAALTVLLVTDAFESRAPAGSYPVVTAKGVVQWASIARKSAPAEPDPRRRRLDRLGMTTIAIDAGAEPEAMAEALDRSDA